jgi:hypothetical protein
MPSAGDGNVGSAPRRFNPNLGGQIRHKLAGLAPA